MDWDILFNNVINQSNVISYSPLLYCLRIHQCSRNSIGIHSRCVTMNKNARSACSLLRLLSLRHCNVAVGEQGILLIVACPFQHLNRVHGFSELCLLFNVRFHPTILFSSFGRRFLLLIWSIFAAPLVSVIELCK